LGEILIDVYSIETVKQIKINEEDWNEGWI
jgi:hypothetical protein